MGNFNQGGGGRFSDNRGGGRGGFGGGRGGFGGGRGGFGGDRARPEMHKATCAECGNECEVPFRPTGDKPVYCSDCFKNQGGGDRGDRGGNRDRGGFGGGRDRDRGGRGDFGEKRMHKATCAECGNECEVPFKPSGDKPVYCSNCFGKDDGGFKSKKTDESKQVFELLNTKLDRIIKALEAAGIKKADAVVKPAHEEKKEDVKKFLAKKSEKKEAVKKEVEKKPEVKAKAKAKPVKKAK